MKTLDEIRTLLALHREELAGSYKVQEIGIFGSYARGEQSGGSDIEVFIAGLDFERFASDKKTVRFYGRSRRRKSRR
jgi:predicted nucleotidyltransferase